MTSVIALLAVLPLAGAETRDALILEFQAEQGLHPRVSVVGAQSGQHSLELRDDGLGLDAVAGDGRYTGYLEDIVPDQIGVTLRFGQQTLFEDMYVTRGDDGLRQVEMRVMDGRLWLELDRGKKARESPGVAPSTATSAMLVWGILWTFLNIAASLYLLWTSRRPVRPAVTSSGEPPRVDPIGLDEGAVAAAIQGPLSRFRVLVIGPVPVQTDRVIRCLEPGPLPEELVGAASQLALVEGPPVAVLVTDASAMDSPGHRPVLEELDRCLGRRAPLWAVNAPRGWERWEPPAS